MSEHQFSPEWCRAAATEIERLQVELQSSRVAARGLADECDRQREQIVVLKAGLSQHRTEAPCEDTP